jgi:hypothetical protein
VAANFADAIQPSRHSIQRDVDIHKLTHSRLADGLQRIIVLQLDGAIVGVVAERLQLPRQILTDPISPLLQFGSASQQTDSYLFERFGISGHATPVLAFSNYDDPMVLVSSSCSHAGFAVGATCSRRAQDQERSSRHAPWHQKRW